MQKVDAIYDRLGSGSQTPSKIPPSLGIDVVTPCATPCHPHETAPLLSLFDNTIFDHKATPSEASESGSTTDLLKSPSTLPSKPPERKHDTQFDELRRSLLAIMPSQKDIKTLLLATEALWTVWFDLITASNSDDARSSWMSFCFSSLTTSHPSFIARALLLVATSLQQFSDDHVLSQLGLPLPPQELVEKILSHTTTLVTSNDELVGTVEGLECLVLQGVYYCNEGKPRRAWLCFRRALDVAQLMGLHHRMGLSDKDTEPEPLERLRHIWWIIFEADRFIAMLLGLPYGIANKHCGLETGVVEAAGLSREEIYRRKLTIVAGDIIDRNHASKSSAFTATQEIDEKLEALASEMPAEWWGLPALPCSSEPEKLAHLNSRVRAQFLHYQCETFLHLPFMLRSAAEPRFIYNKSVCLKATRELIRRYMVLRELYASYHFVCRVTDFQAFTSVIILLLNLLEPRSSQDDYTQQQRDAQDWQEIDKVMHIFSDKTAGIDNAVATQGIKAIKALSAIGRNGGQNSGSMKLAIPYFGTLSIAKGSRSQFEAATQSASESTSRWPPHHHAAAPLVTQSVPVLSPPDSQQYQNLNRAAPDSYHIDFSPSKVVPAINPADPLSVSDALDFPEDDPTVFQTFFELDQGVGENWNFSLEGMI